MELDFEWDPDKAASNWRKHRVSFETAILVFYDPNAVLEQDRVVDGETRWQAIGLAENGLMLVVAHVVAHEDATEVIRIVSARRVNRKERRRYEQANGSI